MTDKQRAAFEAWASGYDVQMFIDRSRHDKSLYAHAETNDAWAAWQAGIEHAETRMNRAGRSDSEIELPALPEAEIDDAGAFMSDAQVMSIDSAKEYARVAVEHDRQRKGEVVVTKDEAGYIVAVTRQDKEGRILSVIAEADRQRGGEPVGNVEIKGGLVVVGADAEYLGDGVHCLYTAPQPANQDYKQLFEQMCERCDALDAKLAEYSEREPVAWQFYDDGRWWNGDDRIKDHRKNTENAGYKTRDLYTAPQPAVPSSKVSDDFFTNDNPKLRGLNEPVKVNAIFETQDDEIIGTTDAKVERVEWQDDGSLTVVIDYWPQTAEPRLDAPAQVGPVRFGIGVKWSNVIRAAQRHHEYMRQPEQEQARMKKFGEAIKAIQPAEPDDPNTSPSSGKGPFESASDLINSINEPGEVQPVDIEKRNATVTLHFESAEAASLWAGRANNEIALRENTEPVKVPSDAQSKADRFRNGVARILGLGSEGGRFADTYLLGLIGDLVELADECHVRDERRIAMRETTYYLLYEHKEGFSSHPKKSDLRKHIKELDAENDRLHALLARYRQNPTIPAGWHLVPKVPTHEMIVAFVDQWYCHRQSIDDPQMGDAYQAMLEAAPEPPCTL